MKLNVEGAKQSSFNLADSTFGIPYNEPLIHQVVTSYLSTARSGTKAQKTRSEVSGGGAKPWNQKGTGRARAGTIRSPIFTGGGQIFAAKPRSFAKKVNRKMYRNAMKSVLSELIRQDRLTVFQDFNLLEPKTKLLKNKLDSLGLSNVLIVVEALDKNLLLASRNLINVNVLETNSIDIVSLIGHEKVVITLPAIKLLEEKLS
ncbi:MAG: 50S ribosomal protein L4 [Gammaproteobacteria bacterium TMED78]|nr:MAG: 50S ribosomal protein L4 [Gammaproteobacteria bacterium TMED78]|tara:strand:+ start:17737 stop:18345 length:609 start_codon:yes stop_codon:yes gene_type:complete